MHLTRDMSELHASLTAETVVFAKTGEHLSLVIQSAPAAGEEQTFKDDDSGNGYLASGEKVQVTGPSKMPVTSQLQSILKRQRAAATTRAAEPCLHGVIATAPPPATSPPHMVWVRGGHRNLGPHPPPYGMGPPGGPHDRQAG